MQPLKILNSKEKKEITKLLNEGYNCDFSCDFDVFRNQSNRIFLLSKDFSKINVEKLRINSLGLYLGEIYDNSIRLSIEGSQLIGKTAKKNLIEISDDDAIRWMRGEDFMVNSDLTGFVIVKNKDDFLGCGKVSQKKLFNYVPKERRMSVSQSM
ncbi:MAG: hypothetical protein ABIJ34_05810 [archaeon]